MTVPEWLAIIALTAILGIIGWGFRRMIDTQDSMATNMATMTLDITKLCGKIEMSALIQLQDKRICDNRHEENVSRLKEISQDIRNLEG